MENEPARTIPDVSRALAIVVCAVWIIACLAYAYFRESLPDWWRGYGGGIPYVVFWITFWFVFFPYRRCILAICLFAVSFTCLLEVLQLWKPDWLTRFRSTRLGAALLGSGFDWNDFLPYFIGGVIGYLVLKGVESLDRSRFRSQCDSGTRTSNDN
jgi:hypothetical protein